MLRVLHALSRHPAGADHLAGVFVRPGGGLAALTQRHAPSGEVRGGKGGAHGQWAFYVCLEALADCLSSGLRRTDALAAEALSCGLIETLVGLLPGGDAVVTTDPAQEVAGHAAAETAGLPRGVEVALVVKCLGLLGAEAAGVNAARVKERLDSAASWHTASSQRQDLYLPSSGGGGTGALASSGSVLALLPSQAKFALPAPPSPSIARDDGGHGTQTAAAERTAETAVGDGGEGPDDGDDDAGAAPPKVEYREPPQQPDE